MDGWKDVVLSMQPASKKSEKAPLHYLRYLLHHLHFLLAVKRRNHQNFSSPTCLHLPCAPEILEISFLSGKIPLGSSFRWKLRLLITPLNWSTHHDLPSSSFCTRAKGNFVFAWLVSCRRRSGRRSGLPQWRRMSKRRNTQVFTRGVHGANSAERAFLPCGASKGAATLSECGGSLEVGRHVWRCRGEGERDHRKWGMPCEGDVSCLDAGSETCGRVMIRLGIPANGGKWRGARLGRNQNPVSCWDTHSTAGLCPPR